MNESLLLGQAQENQPLDIQRPEAALKTLAQIRSSLLETQRAIGTEPPKMTPAGPVVEINAGDMLNMLEEYHHVCHYSQQLSIAMVATRLEIGDRLGKLLNFVVKVAQERGSSSDEASDILAADGEIRKVWSKHLALMLQTGMIIPPQRPGETVQ